jgi:hypothetical protein
VKLRDGDNRRGGDEARSRQRHAKPKNQGDKDRDRKPATVAELEPGKLGPYNLHFPAPFSFDFHPWAGIYYHSVCLTVNVLFGNFL